MATTILKGVIIDGKEVSIDIYKFKMEDYKQILRVGIAVCHTQGKIDAFDYQPKAIRSLKKG